MLLLDKTFDANSVVPHTSCMTEAEKYEGKFAKVKKPAQTPAPVKTPVKTPEVADTSSRKRPEAPVETSAVVQDAGIVVDGGIDWTVVISEILQSVCCLLIK